MAENFDQTRTRSPFTTVDGTETIVLNQGGVTKGGFLSVLRTWILDSLSINREQIDGATEFGRNLLTLEDAVELNDLIEHPTPYTPPALATELEIEEGTEDGERMFSPELLVSAIAFHAGPKIPVSISANMTIAESNVGSILICAAASEIDITIPVLAGVTKGIIHVINLEVDPVNIVPAGTTLIDSTGEVATFEVVQYAHVELIYIGDNTWYLGVK